MLHVEVFLIKFQDYFEKMYSCSGIKSILIRECQHKLTRVNTNQNESTRINTSPTRVNTNQHESDRVNTNQHESDTNHYKSTRVRHESTRVT